MGNGFANELATQPLLQTENALPISSAEGEWFHSAAYLLR